VRLTKILAVMSALWIGGAQISTLEFLRYITSAYKDYNIELKTITCESSKEVASKLSSMHIEYYEAPCYTVMGYPVLEVHKFQKLVEWADIVWITDVEYLVAPWIKRIRSVPIVAHLHSYALICPWWGALYRLNELCLKKCSAWRITRCKQGINLELAKISLLGGAKANLYWLLDFIKGPLDYYKWKKITMKIVDSIDYFIAVSNGLRNIVVSHLPELKSKIDVVYNPVAEGPWQYVLPTSSKKVPGDEEYILYPGGSSIVKGPHIIINAFKQICLDYSMKLSLYITNALGTWIEEFTRKISKDNRSCQIKLFSKLPDSDFFSIMSRAKAVILPSIWPEPLPTVLIESLSLGVPAIGSNRGGIPEIIESEEYGIVVDPTIDSVSKAIVKILSRSYDKEKLFNYALTKFGKPNVKRLIKIFEKVVHKNT